MAKVEDKRALRRAMARISAAGVGGMALWVAGAAASAPAWATVPGGYDVVAGVATVPPSGGSVTAQLISGSATVNVPGGAFSSPVQVIVTSPLLSSAAGGGLSALAGAGVLVEQAGVPIQGNFAAPITLSVNSPAIAAGSQAVAVSSSGEVPIGATISAGSASVALSSSTNVAIVSQTASQSPAAPASPAAASSASSSSTASGTVPAGPGSAVPGATTAQTGLALRGEAIAAGALGILGAAGLWLSLRRGRPATRDVLAHRWPA